MVPLGSFPLPALCPEPWQLPSKPNLRLPDPGAHLPHCHPGLNPLHPPWTHPSLVGCSAGSTATSSLCVPGHIFILLKAAVRSKSQDQIDREGDQRVCLPLSSTTERVRRAWETGSHHPQQTCPPTLQVLTDGGVGGMPESDDLFCAGPPRGRKHPDTLPYFPWAGTSAFGGSGPASLGHSKWFRKASGTPGWHTVR